MATKNVNVLGRVLSLVVSYAVIAAFWKMVMGFIADIGGAVGTITTIFMYLVILLLPVLVFGDLIANFAKKY